MVLLIVFSCTKNYGLPYILPLYSLPKPPWIISQGSKAMAEQPSIGLNTSLSCGKGFFHAKWDDMEWLQFTVI